MNYKSIYNGYDFIHEDDLLRVLLHHRGVDDADRLLKLSKEEVFDGQLLKNMDVGLTLLNVNIKEKRKILIVVDSDADGYASAAEIYLYIKDIDPDVDIEFVVHGGKQHGIVLEEIDGIEYDLLIVPDAGTNDIEICKGLKNQGKEILILDHHIIEEENPYAVVINCRDSVYPNSTLSGAGVVYKFCKEYDKKYKCKFADKYLNLVALGCIADSVDLRNHETRYLTLKGLRRFSRNNEFLKCLLEKQEYSTQGKITIKTVGWYIAPLINAVTRVGTIEERRDVFEALIGVERASWYQPRRKKKDDPKPDLIEETLQQLATRTCVNLKSKQDREATINVDLIEEKIENEKLNENKILAVDCTEILKDGGSTGLIANKIASKHKRPVLILREKKKDIKKSKDKANYKVTYGGSARNYKLFPIYDFQEFLKKTELFNSLGGHPNAFGFDIDKDRIEELIKKANEELSKIKIVDTYNVDYEIPIGRLKNRHIEQVAEWEHIWGNMLDEPLFAITDIYIDTTEIKLIGAKKNMIRFESNGVTFIKKFTNEETYNDMILRKSKGLRKKRVHKVKLDIIGKFVINEWEGNKYPQVEIVDFNSIEEDIDTF